ncbi:MAG: hypothetical protein JRG79_17050 [Deltaproteobacteria bacterium]|nr:hypothetical protein [Deltaproteobacteria bacterium]
MIETLRICRSMLRAYLPLKLFVVYVCTMTSVSAATWVTNIESSPEEYSVERRGNVVQVQVYSSLIRGDIIIINGENSKIQLESDDGSIVTISKTDSPFTVESTGEPADWDKNLTEWVLSLFSEESGSEQNVVSMVSRGGIDGHSRIVIPAVSTSFVQLSSGNRDFCLQWIGGSPPYKIRITRVEVPNIIVAHRYLVKSEVVLPDLALRTGQYLLEIFGSHALSAMVAINVVPQESVPVPPIKFQVTKMSPKMRVTLKSAWLAEQDDGVWRLEAVQQLCRLHNNYYHAAAIINAFGRKN